MKPGAQEVFGKSLLPEERKQGLELLSYISQEFWVLVDGDGDLDESVWSFLFEFAHPVGDGFFCDAESVCGLLKVPALRGFEHKDGHAFGRRIKRAIFRMDFCDTGLKYTDMFVEQGDFIISLLDGGGASDVGMLMTFGVAMNVDHVPSGQRSDMEHCCANKAGPGVGKRYIRDFHKSHPLRNKLKT